MLISVGIALVAAALLALLVLGAVFKKTQSMALAIFSALSVGMLSAAYLLNIAGLPVPIMPFALVILSAAVSFVVGAATIVKTGSAFLTVATSMLTGPLLLFVSLSLVG